MARHFEFNMQTLKQISAVYVQFVTVWLHNANAKGT